VVLACRSLDKGHASIASLPDVRGSVDVRQLDLASLQSIHAFVDGMGDTVVDVLINNAGVMAPPRMLTADGFELQFGVNHLGHFALTGLLWDNLMESNAPRVVTVSSNMHKPGVINFDDLQSEKNYNGWKAYSQSKLANVLFMNELHRRSRNLHANFKSIAAHPGYSHTNLSAGAEIISGGFVKRIANAVERVIAQPASMGALPQIYAATAEEVPSGAYVGPDGFGEWRGYPKLVNTSERAKDRADAERLWQVSEELTKVSF
jgi:NAD(P)-dependent dehydrogenase (short-subunit alcohol dehydrogenase family)